MSQLSENARSYDVYPLIDETHGRPTADCPEKVIWHSASECRKIGLTQVNGLWWCGDFPIYFALRSLPSYSHYLMIEYDVQILEDDCGFINELGQIITTGQHRDVDFAGISFHPDGGGGWATAWQETFPRETSYYATFPLVLVSKRLAGFSFAQRQLEALRRSPVVHCEAFLPSCAFAGGFKAVDFLDLVPGCYDESIVMHQRGRKLGKPLGAIYPKKPKLKAIHPVYSHKEFLDRVYSRYSHQGIWDIEGLSATMRSEDANVLSADLVDAFRQRLPDSVREAVWPPSTNSVKISIVEQKVM
jgi:hypothetical protein